MVQVRLIDQQFQNHYFKPVQVMFVKYLHTERGDDELSQSPFEIVWHTEDELAYMFLQTMYASFSKELGMQMILSHDIAKFQFEGTQIPLLPDDILRERDEFSMPPDPDEDEDFEDNEEYEED